MLKPKVVHEMTCVSPKYRKPSQGMVQVYTVTEATYQNSFICYKDQVTIYSIHVLDSFNKYKDLPHLVSRAIYPLQKDRLFYHSIHPTFHYRGVFTWWGIN